MMTFGGKLMGKDSISVCVHFVKFTHHYFRNVFIIIFLTSCSVF